jgi:hypothetical protein
MNKRTNVILATLSLGLAAVAFLPGASADLVCASLTYSCNQGCDLSVTTSPGVECNGGKCLLSNFVCFCVGLSYFCGTNAHCDVSVGLSQESESGFICQ